MSGFDIALEMRYYRLMSLNVSLTPHLEAFIHDSVSAGRYQSASEVVRTALRLLEESERRKAATLDWLRQEIQKGLDSGPAAPLDVEELLRECRDEFPGS
jgi:antitoxin ParD1/3/4